MNEPKVAKLKRCPECGNNIRIIGATHAAETRIGGKRQPMPVAMCTRIKKIGKSEAYCWVGRLYQETRNNKKNQRN